VNGVFHQDLVNLTYVGYRYYLRDGYKETDLVDYRSHNLKVNGSVHYKLTPKDEMIVASSFGTGTTVYQGDDRFSLRDILFFQNRVEVRRDDKYFIRFYATNEDAGRSFDAYNTALILQNSVKGDLNWGLDYQDYFLNNYNWIIAGDGNPNSWFARNKDWLDTIPGTRRLAAFENYLFTHKNYYDSLVLFHNLSRLNAADAATFKGNARLVPGTAAFDSAYQWVTTHTNREGGSGFFDHSALYHLMGEYRFNVGVFDIVSGGNLRLYAPYSRGTIFLDTVPNQRIYNGEGGVYLGIERKIAKNNLKLSFTNRVDKNQNFNFLWSPAASAVYVYRNHVLRFSASSAIRNPTLTDQYINLNVGRATLLGNLHGFDSLVTISSFLDAITGATPDHTRLSYFHVDPIRPEKVKTIEFGYRGTIGNKLFIDANYYFSWYQDFIGYKIGARIDWPSNSIFVNRVDVYRVAANASDIVTTQGFSIGANYFIRRYFGISANYSWNKLDLRGSTDPIIPAYNTPEHKYNIGVNGRDIDGHIAGLKMRHWSYNINWKWQEGYNFQGSPQFTGYVPAYGMLDAQVSKRLSTVYCIVKVGASNLLDNRVYQVYGGPFVGRMAYISVLFELDKWK
jgi:outer membrane receptor protein involved in Fe transport